MTQADEVSDEMLMALADGELNETDAQRLHRRIATNPELAVRYADFVETRALMQQAFPSEPLPDRLVAAVLQAPPVPASVVSFRKPANAMSPGWGMALAASVVLALGGFWTGRTTAPQMAKGAGIGLVTVHLSTGDAVQLPDGSTARVLASYETDMGLCRLIAQDALRHVACRDGQSGDWALALSVQGGDTGSFVPASDIAAGLIDRLLEEIGAGPALTRTEERSALQH